MEALIILGLILIGIGLIGAVVPLIPGPPLIWGGALLFAWGDHFQRIGWKALVLLAVLAVPATMSDLLVTLITGRRAGMSWRTLGTAMAGGAVGGIFLSPLFPLFGTLFGAILGAVLGVVLAEFLQQKDWTSAWQSAKIYLRSFLIGRAVELALCLLMVGVFAWSVWR